MSGVWGQQRYKQTGQAVSGVSRSDARDVRDDALKSTGGVWEREPRLKQIYGLNPNRGEAPKSDLEPGG